MRSRADLTRRAGGQLLTFNLLALLAIGVVFRCWKLENLPGINGDEAWYGVQAQRLLQGEPFSWRTPTNNPLNPLFFLPLLLLHAVAPPAFALLRIPAAISGILALPVNYLLCRQVFGRHAATHATVLLAVLPINLAYSRFAWDASQSLLATLPVLYLPLLAVRFPHRAGRCFFAGSAAFLLALWVHPTNIFTAPLLIVPAIWLWRAPLQQFLRQGSRGLLAHQPQWMIAAFGAVGAIVAIGSLTRPWLQIALTRAMQPEKLLDFTIQYARLFSGATVYRYLVGSGADLLSPIGTTRATLNRLDWLVLLCLAAVVATWLVSWRRWRPTATCLVLGWLLTCLGFYLVAGPEAIAPHFERYGICLVAPGSLLLTLGFCHWLSNSRQFRPVLLAGAVALAWLLLGVFRVDYFEFLVQTGGRSHRSFRTAAMEPKRAAWEYLLARRNPNLPTCVVTSEYWLELPLSYLATPHRDITVTSSRRRSTSKVHDQLENREQIYYVEFSDMPTCRALRMQLCQAHQPYREVCFLDPTGRPIVSVFEPIREVLRSDRDHGTDAITAAELSHDLPSLARLPN